MRSGAAFFFYGTLINADVRAMVLGREADPGTVLPARLPGFRPVYRRGASYPVLVEAPHGEACGIVVAGLSPADVRRLVAYEGEDYRIRGLPVVLEGRGPCPALVFLPRAPTIATDRPWSFAEWRRRHRRGFLQRLHPKPGAARGGGSAARADAVVTPDTTR